MYCHTDLDSNVTLVFTIYMSLSIVFSLGLSRCKNKHKSTLPLGVIVKIKWENTYQILIIELGT